VPRFLPEYEYDIFVSYAHVDNEPMHQSERGWVTCLIETMRTELRRRLGSKDACELWLDKEQIAGHVQFPPKIIHDVQKSATILIVLSPGYISSEWCGRESQTFLQAVREKTGPATNVFIVEMDKVELDDRPLELRNLNVNGYKFWTQEHEHGPTQTLGYPQPRSDDDLYNRALNLLVYELARHLRSLDNTKQTTTPASGIDRPTVFLAEVTEDLEDERLQVEEYLRQEGLQVLPDTRPSVYFHEPQEYEKALDRDLEQSGFFVQLLSKVSGRKPKTIPQGYPSFQYELAKQKNLQTLQWRSPELKVEDVKDTDHRGLITRETVMAVHLEEFKREIVKRTTSKANSQSQPARGNFGPTVLVDAEKHDLDLGKAVVEVLKKHGMGWTLPLHDVKPSIYRKDLESRMTDCDGFVLVYGKSPNYWAREHIQWLRRTRKLKKPTEPLKTALLEGPPEPKEDVNDSLPNMLVLNCRQGICEIELQKFITSLS
jgi:hypothetical protein